MSNITKKNSNSMFTNNLQENLAETKRQREPNKKLADPIRSSSTKHVRLDANDSSVGGHVGLSSSEYGKEIQRRPQHRHN